MGRRRLRRTVRRKRATVNIKVDPTIAREIWATILLAIGVLTILSIKGSFGPVGNLWVGFLSPILGWGIYIIPVLFIVVSSMMFLSKDIEFGASRIFGIILFMTFGLSLVHLSVPIEHIYDYATAGRYGGCVGFVTNFLFLQVLNVGSVGATIIFITGFLVSLMLVFELSIIELVRFAIPQIKIETSRSHGRLKKRGIFGEDDDEYEEEDISEPEIFIHKSKISSPKNAEKNKDEDIEKTVDEELNEEEEKSGLSINRGDETAMALDKAVKTEHEEIEWEFPSLDLLLNGDSNVVVDEKFLKESAEKIRKKLSQFDIEVAMHEVNVGPTVVQYTLKPNEAVKLSKITSLKNDIALALAAEKVRIEAPIPGKSLVGIEVPNVYRAIVYLREILESSEFGLSTSKLTLPLGRDVAGKPIVASLDSMPHLLIAGTTGSGKSVCMNTFLVSLLYQNSPEDLRLILIDPKRVELSSYNNIPHLLTPVIQDPEKAAISLRWVVGEMMRRYRELSSKRVRNIAEFNEVDGVRKMARIVVVIDELADLMLAAGKEVEASICRIAQMARAVGIHLIIATQSPRVDVITGLIKANIPARIAFAVSNSIDSRIILDCMGAEDLVGKGDMLYLPVGRNKPLRVQGIYVSTEEIERVANRVKLTVAPEYNNEITSTETSKQKVLGVPDSDAGNSDDDLYAQAYTVVTESRKASASLLQRRLKVGYARAARLLDLLEENGVVGPADGAKPRRIMSEEEQM
ncbi:DNA translocase FtsK [Candidatus Gracilibacteria bacterium]|nr:DNA translocase FtsK [Candidatus Gracilibacteria bacterium]